MSTTESVAALQEATRETPASEVRQILLDDGGVIIRGLLSAAQVTRINAEVDAHVSATKPGVENVAEEWWVDFFGRNTKRLTNMVSISPTFRDELIDDDLVHEFAAAMLSPICDDYWMTTAQLIEIGPHSTAQQLHRDMANYPVFLEQGPAAPEIICNFLIALSEFTAENGATRVIPGSNQWPDFHESGRPEQTIPALMDPGDALFISGKICHGGGANVTDDQYRRALAFAFNPGFLMAEEAYPFIIDWDLVRTLSPRVQKILGFRSLHNRSHDGGSMWQVDFRELADFLKLD